LSPRFTKKYGAWSFLAGIFLGFFEAALLFFIWAFCVGWVRERSE